MPPSTAPKTNILRRFRRNRRGSAAVEFALVAPIFFAVLFAIIELALVFFASQILETVTQDTARLIMTGQAQDAAFTQAQFKDAVCAKLTMMFDCQNGVSIDVQSYNDVLRRQHCRDPIDSAKKFVRRTTIARRGRRHRRRAAVLQWPVFVTGLGFNLSNLGSNKRLLTATAAFQNEPYYRAKGNETEKPTIWLRMRRRALELRGNNSGVAAIEFAMIIPLMAVLLVGTNEFAAGVAVDRKVTMMARTLSDLTSQNTSVNDDKLTNFFNASKAIMTPYSSTPVEGTITELFINPDHAEGAGAVEQGCRTAHRRATSSRSRMRSRSAAPT